MDISDAYATTRHRHAFYFYKGIDPPHARPKLGFYVAFYVFLYVRHYFPPVRFSELDACICQAYLTFICDKESAHLSLVFSILGT